MWERINLPNLHKSQIIGKRRKPGKWRNWKTENELITITATEIRKHEFKQKPRTEILRETKSSNQHLPIKGCRKRSLFPFLSFGFFLFLRTLWFSGKLSMQYKNIILESMQFEGFREKSMKRVKGWKSIKIFGPVRISWVWHTGK